MENLYIRDIFRDQDIFITGATGFIGKALIEKLLRSCSDLNRIFVLIRHSKGLSGEERLANIFHSNIYDQVRHKSAELLKKVVPIDGDVQLDGLGISDENKRLLRNVSVVLHIAASVRFDDPLKKAIVLNAKGTYETLKLAEEFSKLKVFLHVSTTFSNPERNEIEENVYPPKVDWKTTIKLTENYSTEILNILNLKYSDFQPNTYTFTKGIAEQIVRDFNHKLPVIIFRPSIVISAICEPVPGWIDNFNGPVGMLVGSGVGLIRVGYSAGNNCLDYIPVDVCVKSMLAACYEKILHGHNPKEIRVYNCATCLIRPITLSEVLDIGEKAIAVNPMEQTVLPPGGGATNSWLLFYIRFILFQLLFAVFADIVFRLMNRKPFFVKLQRKIYEASNALSYFSRTQFTFKNSKFLELNSIIKDEDKKDFEFLQYQTIDIVEYFRTALAAAKYYLLNQPLKATQAARIQFKILTVAYKLFKGICLLFIVRFIYSYFQ